MFASHVQQQVDAQPPSHGNHAKIILARRQLEPLGLRELGRVVPIRIPRLGRRGTGQIDIVRDTQTCAPVLDIRVIETKCVVARHDVRVLTANIRSELQQHIRFRLALDELGIGFSRGIAGPENEHLLGGGRHHIVRPAIRHANLNNGVLVGHRKVAALERTHLQIVTRHLHRNVAHRGLDRCPVTGVEDIHVIQRFL